MNINPIPNSLRPQRAESSGLRTTRDGDSLGRAWIKNASDSRQVGWHTNNLNHLQRQIDQLRIRRVFQDPAVELFPFKILTSPLNPEWTTPEDVYDKAWRAFRVRAGAYGTVAVRKTDGADVNPDDATLKPFPEYNEDIDFLVPSETEAYYVWVDASSPDSPVIDKGTTIPGDGTDDDWWKGVYFLIAKIDTATHSDKRKAIIRQFIRYDIPRCV